MNCNTLFDKLDLLVKQTSLRSILIALDGVCQVCADDEELDDPIREEFKYVRRRLTHLIEEIRR